jgi:crotonobetainyl-CoA:carnitine CoA-transferase CaiB-like acyl-CoA transferase
VARGNILTQDHPRVDQFHSLASPIRLAGTPPEYRLLPPALGEHTAQVLAELGYPPEEIERLRGSGDV